MGENFEVWEPLLGVLWSGESENLGEGGWGVSVIGGLSAPRPVSF